MNRWTLVLAGASLLVSPLAAQSPAPAPKPAVVSLQADRMEIRDALRQLETASGTRILAGPGLTGRLTTQLKDVSLETALTAITGVSGGRWSRILLPEDKAKTITPDDASAIAKAAELIARLSLGVQNNGGPALMVGAALPSRPNAVSLYLVETPPGPSKAVTDKVEEAATNPEQPLPWKLSDDARQDPVVVRTLSQIQGMSPDQVAVMAREFMRNMTPQQMQEIGEAIRRQGPMQPEQ